MAFYHGLHHLLREKDINFIYKVPFQVQCTKEVHKCILLLYITYYLPKLVLLIHQTQSCSQYLTISLTLHQSDRQHKTESAKLTPNVHSKPYSRNTPLRGSIHCTPCFGIYLFGGGGCKIIVILSSVTIRLITCHSGPFRQ